MSLQVEPEAPWGEPENSGIMEPEPEPEGEMHRNTTGRIPYAEPTVPLYQSDSKTWMGVAAAVLGSGIILQNLIVLFVIAKSWPKQTETITYFIIHLACADLIAGTQFLWFNSIDIFLMITHSGVWVLILCGIWMVTIAASIGGIINFGQLRIHILKTAMKNQKFTQRRAFITIALSWILPIVVLFIPPIAGWNCVNCIDHDYCMKKCSQLVFPFTKIYVLLVVGFLFLSIVWIVFIYVWIFVLVHKKLAEVREISTATCNKGTEKHLFNTMMFILLLFFICHFPLAVVLVFDYLTVPHNPVLLDCFQIIVIISFLNSFLNPFVYYWRMPATRDSFWMAIGKRNKTQQAQFFSSNTMHVYSANKHNTLSLTDIQSKIRVNSERRQRNLSIQKQRSLSAIDARREKIELRGLSRQK